MKNQPTTPQTQANPLETPPVVPEEKSNKWLIIALILLFLGASGVAGYLAYQNFQLRKRQHVLVQPVPTLVPTSAPELIKNWKTFINKKYGFTVNYPSYLVYRSDYESIGEFSFDTETGYTPRVSIYFNNPQKLTQNNIKEFKKATKDIDKHPTYLDVGEDEGGGTFMNYYILKEEMVVQIEFVSYPDDKLFIDPTTSNQILSTFKFITLCKNCPLYTPPPPGWCDNGEVVASDNVYNEKEGCFCPGPPKCITN